MKPGSCCIGLAFASVLAVSASLAQAQERFSWDFPPSGQFGGPGILDMPTAHPLPDGGMALSYAGVETHGRVNLAFQITPRLTGGFRYSWVDDFRAYPIYYDRSFDLRYALVEESPRMPAVSVGLRDFGGTGIYSGEFLVATKTFDRLRVTGGLGWGRLGSNGSFENPLGFLGDRFKNRPPAITGDVAGQPNADLWFRGDAAVFGGVQYMVTDKLRLNAEYSSDAYTAEEAQNVFKRKSNLNFGAAYEFAKGAEVSASYLYGELFSFSLRVLFDVANPTQIPGGIGSAPLPVAIRPEGPYNVTGWAQDSTLVPQVRDATIAGFANEGLVVQAIKLEADRVIVRFRETRFVANAQALGRAVRVLASEMPYSVETFVLEIATDTGLATSRVTIQRNDIEDLAYAPEASWQSFARAQIEDAAIPLPGVTMVNTRRNAFSYGLAPYVASSYFDPAEPIRLDFGLQVNAAYEPVNGVILSGSVRQKLQGNRGGLPSGDSKLPRVRTDGYRFAEAETALRNLTAAYYFRPVQDLYGRVTAGYLESMYAGVSGEVLWKPVASRIALGAEANLVRKRGFAQNFDLGEYEIATGHVSAYFEGDGGYFFQVDAGRYLAGDWGATFTLDREFENGIRVGAFATLTDVPFETFGEGAFDKGMRFVVPLTALTGQTTERTFSRTFRPVLRDGGARVDVAGRLYEPVRQFHIKKLQGSWGRFWR